MSELLTTKSVNDCLHQFKEDKTEIKLLSEAYDFLGEHERANRVAECSSHLWFHDNKLHRANYCRDRLCSLCAWRNSRRYGRELVNIVNALPEFRFVFITLTVPNTAGELLRALNETMLSALGKLFDCKFWKSFALGYFRAFEVVCKADLTFHPHIHLLVCVTEELYNSLVKDKSAFSVQLLSEWQRAMQNELITDIDIRPVVSLNTSNDKKFIDYKLAVVKVALYCGKPVTCIVMDDFERTVHNVKWLSEAFRGVRLFSDGGILRKRRQELAEKAKEIAVEKVEPPYLTYYRFNPHSTNYEIYGYVLNTRSHSYQRTLFQQARVEIAPWVRLN